MARRAVTATPEPPVTTNGHGDAQPQALTAAAQRIGERRIGLEVQSKGRRMRAQEWQKECWDYADAIGEVGYGIGQMAGAMAKARLFIGWRPSPKDHPVEAIDENRPGAELAAEQLERLESSAEGLSGLLYDAAYNLQVTGEFYAVGEGTGPDSASSEVWDVRSVDELTTEPGGVIDGERVDIVKVIDEPGATGRRLDPADSFVSRMWRRHPRYGGQATSPMRPIRTEFDELLILSRSIRGTGRSRTNAGMLLMPNTLKVIPLNPVEDATPGYRASTIAADVMEALLIPVADEGSASSVVPIMVEGDGDDLAKVRHLTFDRPIDPVAAAQRAELIQRIGQGMNWPIEITTGIGGSNHWSAWAVTQSMFDTHVAPDLVLLCRALWSGVIRPLFLDQLVAGGMGEDAARAVASDLILWFDESGMISKPNVTSDIIAVANGVYPYVSEEFVRRSVGATEDDAPDEDELAKRAAYIAATAGRRLGATIPGEDVGPPPAVPAPEAPGTPPRATVTASALTAAARSRSAKRAKLGAKLGAIDRALFSRLDAAASAALVRALEKAGSRVRNRAKQDDGVRAVVASGVPAAEVPATLGRAMVASLGFADPDLLDGAFDDLGAKFATWTARAQAQALAAVADAQGLDPAELDDVAAQQSAATAEAWPVLAASLAALAARRLYDPHPMAPPLGEHDSTMIVPPSLIRDAMARAGGAGGALDANGPTGGVATGASIREFLSYNGAAQTGWEWSYGDSEREFPGHADLDGVAFAEWTDDVLAVQPGDEWVGETYRPGDHDGCRCICSPVYAEDSGDGEADVSQEAA